jgi:alanine dehydrogenase
VEEDFDLLRDGLILFTYLHLTANARLTRGLLDSRVIGIAYETIQLPDGSLPLLAPMSAVAGRLAIQMVCACLETIHVGMGAQVTILDIDQRRLNYLEDIFHSRAVILMSNAGNIEESVVNADLVIGSVLIPGAQAPHLVSRELLRNMEPGSAIVDIVIDQGGCAETSRPTTHDNPTYIEEDIVHYCVANMPGEVPKTSTYALTNATMPYVLMLADKGWKPALKENRALARGLNVLEGTLVNRQVAESFGMTSMEYAA